MRTFTRLFAMCAMLALLSPAIWGQVTLPHYDGFDYPALSMLGGQGGWLGINSGDTVWIAEGNLSFPGFPASTGNKITFDGAGQDQVLRFDSTATGIVYFSFLVKVTDVGGLTTTGGYFVGFYQTSTSATTGAPVYIRTDGSDIDFGIAGRLTAPISWSTIKSVGTTYLLVGAYQFVDGTTNDSVKLWIDPDALTFGGVEPEPTLTAVNTLTDMTSVVRFMIRQDAATLTPFIELDELRLGTTWADVTSGSGSTGVKDNKAALVPRELRLEQNYPNPFNPSTRIDFTVAKDGFASLKVFNMIGQEVATLFNGVAKAGTLNTTTFNAANLPSGVYYSVLLSDGQRMVKKLLLVK